MEDSQIMLRRVAYVVGAFPKLSETFIAGEVAEVLRRGLEVKILSLRSPGEELRHDIVARAGLVERTVYDAQRYAKVLREFQPEIVHAHFATRATAVARELAGELGVPFTFTAHGYDIYRKPPADFADRAADAAAVVTVSGANARYIVKTFGVPAVCIRVIPCGVDTERFRPQRQRAAPVHIVCVARLKPYKNQRLLLEACAELQSRGLEFRCVLVGDGPCRDELAAARARLGLERVVELVGAAVQAEVLAWWQRAAVAVLPSESEGMPVCLMEAAACGVPAVATAVGGVPELVEDGVTGLLTPAGDARALAAALERLLRDPELAARLGAAARRRAVERFSVVQQVNRLLALWTGLLRGGGGPVSIPVLDPFGAACDPEMPSLALALDPAVAKRRLKRRLPRLAGEDGLVNLRAIRVTRHKPGRRCLIEYDVEVERPGRPPEAVTLMGKVRAGRYGSSGYRLLNALWDAGFKADSQDGLSVAEPIGVIGIFRMWLQRKVPGRVATDLLAGPGGPALARQIAEAAHKVHWVGVPAERRHTMADELRILRKCLSTVAQVESRWAGRIEHLLDACYRLGAATPEGALRTIHRDFYADQVIVNGARVYLVDFDEYCEGDPALDIGNFLGAITEQSLRTLGDPDALVNVERAMEERFVELSGEATRPAVRAYATLTLARQVYVSTRIPERRPFTGSLLELCEERLGVKH